MIPRNTIFKKSDFLLETTSHCIAISTLINRLDTIDSILLYSNTILKTRFFTMRIQPTSTFGICTNRSLLDLHFVMTFLIKKTVSVINTSLFNDFEICNLLGFLNRWLLLDNRATVCTARSFIRTFYINYKFPINGSTIQSLQPFFFSQQYFYTTTISRDISFLFFIEPVFQSDYLLGIVDNIISLQWSFFFNLKHNSLIAFSYLR